ncbi:agmatinase family protein [Fulvivirgaceae bacterium PWU4]|uniref:Agmatinase family protein n=1 Tax=Chryseosolibacter histidini TaxID=2782349 RepID=A0AAP2DQA4_9BACT|nr:agmatinase family protein [Chryseosolibacter histidini]MBT1700496.1 agmatinase family protein [Chryseosolibacter histidini]
MTKNELIAQFDPNGPGVAGNLFGLPFTPATAEVVIIPVPWEVTVSYHAGTARGPLAVLEASSQVDLALKEIPNAWQLGISVLPFPADMPEESEKLRDLSVRHIRALEAGEKMLPGNPITTKINEASENLNIYVKSTAQKWLKEKKIVGLLGGDHSTPLGLLRALGEQYDRFGILQIDAHADLRKAYEGFTYSHASIMFNALKLPSIGRLVQVGIRDYCDEELRVIERSMGRVTTYFDEDVKAQLYQGKSWENICDRIIQDLPEHVYISFDIDGLNPKLCPNTGTPVAGGLEFEQAIYLLKKLVRSGRRIIGFDLSEVAPAPDNDWDANVGARLLYQLCNWAAVSQGRLSAS